MLKEKIVITHCIIYTANLFSNNSKNGTGSDLGGDRNNLYDTLKNNHSSWFDLDEKRFPLTQGNLQIQIAPPPLLLPPPYLPQMSTKGGGGELTFPRFYPESAPVWEFSCIYFINKFAAYRKLSIDCIS